MSQSPLTIITGASRGMGLAIAQQLLDAGHRVLGISRKPSGQTHPQLTEWCCDLSDAPAVARKLQDWLTTLDTSTLTSVTLINNAGVVVAPSPMADQSIDELSNSLRVGLEAPMLLSAAYLHATAAWSLPRKLLFISSGLGQRAMAGSASYCASKAGMDHLARCIALEQAQHPNPALTVSLAPGVIDTDMQLQLRSADPAVFPDQQMFARLKSGGQLDSPAQAAAKVIGYLARPDYGSKPVGDVRDA